MVIHRVVRFDRFGPPCEMHCFRFDVGEGIRSKVPCVIQPCELFNGVESFILFLLEPIKHCIILL